VQKQLNNLAKYAMLRGVDVNIPAMKTGL